MASQTNHSVGPKRATWTHLALRVKDIDATIAWYERFTHLKLLTRTQDDDGMGAWLGDDSKTSSPFMLVVSQFYEGHDPFAPATHHPIGPFAHMGIEMPSREDIDNIAARGKAEGCLALGPMQMPKHVGYICFLKDPDGNTIEFSFDQGIYEKVNEVWGAEKEPA